MLEHTSILIPVLPGRAPYLAPALRLFADETPDVQIIIGAMDSAYGEVSALPEAGRLGDLHICQHDSKVAYHLRLKDLRARARGRFLVIHPDDDIMDPVMMAACEEFLLANPDYSAAMGRALRVSRGHDPSGTEAFQVSSYPVWSHEQTTPRERILHLFQHYHHLWYSLQRADSVDLRLHHIALFEGDPMFSQYLDACVPVAVGRTKVLEGIGFIRRLHDQNTGTRMGAQRDPNVFPHLMFNPAFSQRYAHFRDLVLDLVAGASMAADIPVDAESLREELDLRSLQLLRWGLFLERGRVEPGEERFLANLRDPRTADGVRAQKLLAAMWSLG